MSLRPETQDSLYPPTVSRDPEILEEIGRTCVDDETLVRRHGCYVTSSRISLHTKLHI